MINKQNIRTYPMRARRSKVETASFAKKPEQKSSFLKFYDSLPNILKANELRSLTDSIASAHKRKRAVIFMCGAHVIKCGLNPVVIELIKKNVITCLCLNGAGIIHDFEIAFCGKTSEDVAEGLKNGSFGMCRETGDFLNSGARDGVRDGLGLGYAVAKKIRDSKLRFKESSLLFNAYKRQIPVCVFVAIGTDIIHQHPSFDASLTAEGSIRDFYSLVEHIRSLNNGGVVLNFGSAVILPEVFLKALNLSRNLGEKVKDFTTANFDMFYHYRPSQNVVSRPVQLGGKGYYILGHHEIMLPFLAQSIIEKI